MKKLILLLLVLIPVNIMAQFDTIFYDSFNRADTAQYWGTADSGLAWANTFPADKILSNNGYMDGQTGHVNYVDTGYSNNYSITMINGTWSGGNMCGVMIRGNSYNDFIGINRLGWIMWRISGVTGYEQYYFRKPDTNFMTFSSGDTVTVTLKNNVISLTVNGVTSPQTYTTTLYQTSTKQGVCNGGDGNININSYEIQSLEWTPETKYFKPEEIIYFGADEMHYDGE